MENKSMKKEKIYKENRVSNNKILPGDLPRSPDAFSKIIVFIDNAYLIRLKNYFFKSKIKYDLGYFIKNLSNKNNLIIEKIFLYDAPPYQSGSPGLKEKSMKESYDEFVQRFQKQGIIVREGRTQRLKVGNSFVYKQKGVDMLLGIDAVGVIKDFPYVKKIILLTGDSDFVPVVDKLKSFGFEVVLWTYFNRDRLSPFSRSNYLIQSVSRYLKLTKEDFLEACEAHDKSNNGKNETRTIN
jgi:uncharacterized LabA/DUF88 family protein